MKKNKKRLHLHKKPPPSFFPIMYSNVVITAPHAACPTSTLSAAEPRECDRAAERMADALHAALPGSVLLKNTDMLRADVDMNRAESRRSEFRRQVAAALKRDTVLIDTHSFPHGEFGDADVVLMEARRSTPSPVVAELLRCIAEALPSPQRRVAWVQAHSTVNDIEYSAVMQHRVALAFLLEVHEQLGDAEIRAVASAVLRCFAPPPSPQKLSCEQCGEPAAYRSLMLCGARICSALCRDMQLSDVARQRQIASYSVTSRGIVARVYRYWIDEYGILHSVDGADGGGGAVSLLTDTERMTLTRLRLRYGSVVIDGSTGGCTTPERPWIVLWKSADAHDALNELTDESAQHEIREFFDGVLRARGLRFASN